MRAALLALLLVGCASPAAADPQPSCVTRLPYVGGPVVGYGRDGVMSGSKQKAGLEPAQSLSRCAQVRQDVRQA